MNDSSTRPKAFQNPFVALSPELLRPDQLVELFVDELTPLQAVKQLRHSFIWGSSGTGKSMMLRYLEPQCQFLVHESPDDAFKTRDAFVAVYCPCREGYFNKTEFLLLDPPSSQIITEHLLNLFITRYVISFLQYQFPPSFFSAEETNSLVDGVLELFDPASMASSMEEARTLVPSDDKLEWLSNILYIEMRKLSTFLRKNALGIEKSVYRGAATGYHDFLLPFMKKLGGLKRFQGATIMIMLDDAHKLSSEQQKVVNTWVSNRNNEYVCFKIAADLEGYETFATNNPLFVDDPGDRALYTDREGLIQSPHDFTEVNLDDLHIQNEFKYAQKIRLIANRRLQYAGLPITEIQEFLPMRSTEARFLNKVTTPPAKERALVGLLGERSEYHFQLAITKLSHYLRKRKLSKSYAGFLNLVYLSSGRVTSFLEPCYLMAERCLERLRDADADFKSLTIIPPAVQHAVVSEYSRDFLVFSLSKIVMDLPPERRTHLESLITLIYSMGRLFHERLQDPDSPAARIFAFTVRGKIPRDLEGILRLGVRYRYFQIRTYISGAGRRREKWYTLNRMIYPVFKLDPLGFEVGVSFTPDALQLACKDPERFVLLRVEQMEQDGKDNMPMFSVVGLLEKEQSNEQH